MERFGKDLHCFFAMAIIDIDQIWIDDSATVSTQHGTIGFGNSNPSGICPVYIGYSALWVVQAIKDNERNGEPPLFPIPTPTYPPLPWNGTNPPYNPFSYPFSEVPININNVGNFFKEHFGAGNGLSPETYVEIGVGIVTIIAIILGSITGTTS